MFAGFVTDVGGRTSHTAIVARSMDIPAVVGARSASQLVRQDDWVIIDGDAGVVIVDPSPIILAEYGFKQRQGDLERGRLSRLRHTPAVTLDGQTIDLLANIEMPEDTPRRGQGRRRRRRPVPQRVPVHGPRGAALTAARRGRAVPGLPARGRGHAGHAGHHPHHRRRRRQAAGRQAARDEAHLNPALGLRAIRWSLADPAMFLTQLRAILRAAAHGEIHLLIPMLAHASEIRQTLSLVDFARAELDNRGVAYGPLKLGAMIEIPAAALTLRTFLKYFDFLSIGTNDLIQYTLAIDRADESVAHLYDPAASGGAAPGGRHHRRVPAPGQGRERVRRDGRRRQPSRGCCWAWACAASRCTRRRSWPSSRRCCAPTPASSRPGRRRCSEIAERRRRAGRCGAARARSSQ